MTLRAAVLGTGSWARKIHLPALASHPSVELVGVWGRRGDAARAVADEFSIEAHDDLDRLVSSVDLVSIAVTPDAQPVLARMAAQAGAHLVLEKPAARDVDECRALAAAIQAAGVQTSVFLSRLWDPARQGWLEATRARGWDSVHYEWVSAGMRPESPGGSGWRKDAGPLLDVGPHVLSLAMYLAGPVLSVRASAADYGRLALHLNHSEGCITSADVDLVAAVTRTSEHIRLEGSGAIASYANPDVVDFVGAYSAMLDDLIARVSTPQVVSPRGAASGLLAAIDMADILDEARSSLHRAGRDGAAGAPG